MKKRYVAASYLFVMYACYLVLPLFLLWIAFSFVTYDRIRWYMVGFSGAALMLGPYIGWRFLDGASVVVDKTMITNLVRDRTDNWGWSEELNKIQSVSLVGNAAVKPYYYNCKSKCAMLIDFGRGNVKYIAMDEFTKGQRKRLLKLLQKRSQGNRKPNDRPLTF